MDGWRKCELIIGVGNINKSATYESINKAIIQSLQKVDKDEDKSAIYAAARIILDPTNTKRYLNIISR